MKKTRLIYLPLLLAALSLSLQSCLKDDEELFPQKSAERITEAMDVARKALTSSEYGWVFEMFPEKTQCYGGYVFCVRFDAEKSYVSGELGDGYDQEVPSLWKMTNDNGPTLTFDSYNWLLHYFATPSGSSSRYQAYKGEFEFMVMDVNPDIITLRGKKTGNTMYLRRLTVPASQYLAEADWFNDPDLNPFGFAGNVGGHDVKAQFDLDNRYVDLYVDGKHTAEVAYSPTRAGLRLYEDFEVSDGIAIRDIMVKTKKGELLPTSITVKGEGAGAEEYAMSATRIEGWRPFYEFPGDYDLVMQDPDGVEGSHPVTLVDGGDNKTLWMTGFNPEFDIKVTYNRTTGTLAICSQIFKDKTHKNNLKIKVDGKSYYLGMVARAIYTGLLYNGYTTTYGLATKDVSENGVMKLQLSDNGKWGSYKTSNFVMYAFTSTSMSSSTYMSKVSIPKSYRFSYLGWTSTTLYHPTMLVKKE